MFAADRVIAVARVAAAVVFIVFGIGKFTAHESELASFKTYGLPWPDAFVYAIGVLEIAGGLALLTGARLAVRLAALALAGDMVGAVVVSGFKEGEAISLTLAPALLLTMLVLLRAGPGRLGRDR
jgi:putative oxidoreductase